MAKQGMKRIDRTHTKPKNDVTPVPEIQGKAKHGKVPVNPFIAGTKKSPEMVYHMKPQDGKATISSAYAQWNTELARENLANDLPAADIQDL